MALLKFFLSRERPGSCSSHFKALRLPSFTPFSLRKSIEKMAAPAVKASNKKFVLHFPFLCGAFLRCFSSSLIQSLRFNQACCVYDKAACFCRADFSILSKPLRACSLPLSLCIEHHTDLRYLFLNRAKVRCFQPQLCKPPTKFFASSPARTLLPISWSAVSLPVCPSCSSFYGPL